MRIVLGLESLECVIWRGEEGKDGLIGRAKEQTGQERARDEFPRRLDIGISTPTPKRGSPPSCASPPFPLALLTFSCDFLARCYITA